VFSYDCEVADELVLKLLDSGVESLLDLWLKLALIVLDKFVLGEVLSDEFRLLSYLQ